MIIDSEPLKSSPMPEGTTDKQSPVTLVAALAVLFAFAFVLWHMINISASADDKLWTRSTYVFGSVEAIAFAAAGFLFGREVHRAQAVKAEQRAASAEKSATEASTTAADALAKGRSIAELARAKANRLDERRKTLTTENTADRVAEADLREIADLANRLF